MLHRLTQPQIGAERQRGDQLGKTDTRISIDVDYDHRPSLKATRPDDDDDDEDDAETAAPDASDSGDVCPASPSSSSTRSRDGADDRRL
jgi:hypothetical protein